jgi:hypothetical protein
LKTDIEKMAHPPDNDTAGTSPDPSAALQDDSTNNKGQK